MARKRSVFKLFFMFGGVCLTMWQLPGLLDRVERVTGGLNTGMPAGSSAADLDARARSMAASADFLSLLKGDGGAAKDTAGEAAAEDDMVLFAGAEDLNDEERDRLLREATRRQPTGGK